MSRKIKFRLWDNSNYYYRTDLYSAGIAYGQLRQSKDVIIEQFVGIQDKNGKDIYEGDIVSIYTNLDESHENYQGDNNTHNTYVVFDEESCGFVCVKNKNPKWYKQKFELTWRFNDTNYHNRPFIFEVIGNIHENKELINDEI